MLICDSLTKEIRETNVRATRPRYKHVPATNEKRQKDKQEKDGKKKEKKNWEK